MEETEKNRSKSPGGPAMDVLGYLSVAFVFILPLKFGMMAGLPETATAMPSSFMELIYFSWPYFTFSLFSAALLGGVIIYEVLSYEEFKLNDSFPLAISWCLLLFSSLIGFIGASTLDFPLIQLNLLLGIACLVLAAHQILAARPSLRIWYVNAIVASTLLVALMGLNQYFAGFNDTLNYVYSKEMATGVKVSGNMLSRLRETRVFATFSICNSLGAHFVLTIPLCAWAMLSKSSTLKTVVTTLVLFALYISPSLHLTGTGFFILAFTSLTVTALTLTRFPETKKRMISIVVLLPTLGIMLFVFRHTNSRGAFLAAAAAIFAVAAMAPLKAKTKLMGAALALLCVVPFFFTDILARSLKSMYFRFDYFLAALKMFAAHPFVGVGWGDFFHEYMHLKQVPGSESPHTPHNFILSFASQTGVAGLLASLWVMAAPFVFVVRRIFKSSSSGREISRLETAKNEAEHIREEKKRRNNSAKSAKKTTSSQHIEVGVDWFDNVVLAGWFAWCVHALIDFNIQVPGTVGVAVVLLLLLRNKKGGSSEADDKATTSPAAPDGAKMIEKNDGQCDHTESADEPKTTARWASTPTSLFKKLIAGSPASRLCLAASAILVVATMKLSLDRWTVETNQTRLMSACGMTVMRPPDWSPPSDTELDSLLNSCVKSAPYSPFPWICVGNFYQRMREWGRSEYFFKEALKRSPERASVHYHLFLAQAALGKFDKALGSIEKAARLFPNAYASIAEKYKNGCF